MRRVRTAVPVLALLALGALGCKRSVLGGGSGPGRLDAGGVGTRDGGGAPESGAAGSGAGGLAAGSGGAGGLATGSAGAGGFLSHASVSR